jgi:hypothetical protein
MYREHRSRPGIVEAITVGLLHVVLARRWITEAAIVALLLIMLLVELGLRLWPGSHPVAHIVTWGLLFGLIASWTYVNRAALAAWEQQDREEREPPC